MSNTQSRAYFAHDWYWVASDGRLFSSSRQALIKPTDAAYQMWCNGGGVAYPWPVDEAGAQTDAALQAAFKGYGLFVNLAFYAADLRWQKEVGGVTVNGMRVATDDRSKLMLAGARSAAEADQGFATKWVAVDGSVHDIDAAGVVALSNAVLAHVAACFRVYAEVVTGLSASPPTISSRDQIDARFAAIGA